MRIFFRVCCEHCGMPKRRREPVQECWVVGEQHFLHGGCRAGWEAAPAMQLPSGSKVFGIAPGTAVNTAARVEAFTSFNCPVGGEQRSEEHTVELPSLRQLVCRLLLG